MSRSTKALALVSLAAGALLGYAAASGNFWPNRPAAASATPPQRSGGLSADSLPAACCTPDNDRGALAAKANTTAAATQTQPAGKKPNIVFIMGDDVGMWNIGAYHRGLMAGRTPNLDRLAAEGVLFTDYYAEASCTAGR